MNGISNSAVAVISAIIGLALVSVIVSRNAAAPQVVAAAGTALSQVIAAAVNPAGSASTNGNNGLSAFSLPSFGAFPAI